MSQNLQLSSIQTAVVCICRVTFILHEVFYTAPVYQYTECHSTYCKHVRLSRGNKPFTYLLMSQSRQNFYRNYN